MQAVLGYGAPCLGAAGQALLIRVLNPEALAASQSGVAGEIAAMGVPQATMTSILTAMKQKLGPALAAEGVEAQLEIVADSQAPAKGSDLVGGAVMGGLLVGLAWLGKALLRR